jgi:hypothetical protein
LKLFGVEGRKLANLFWGIPFHRESDSVVASAEGSDATARAGAAATACAFLMRRPTVDVRVASCNHWGNDGFGFFFQRNWNSQPAYTRPRAGQYYEMQQRWW